MAGCSDGGRVEQCSGAVQSVLSGIDPTNRMSLSFWPCFYEESNRNDVRKLFNALTMDLDGMLKAIELDPDNDVGEKRSECVGCLYVHMTCAGDAVRRDSGPSHACPCLSASVRTVRGSALGGVAPTAFRTCVQWSASFVMKRKEKVE